MKFLKTKNLYKAANVEFNPETLEATSYDWWCFLKVIKGKRVFNAYNYSNTTCKHQQKVRAVLDQLNITIDLIIETPDSLNSAVALGDSITLYETRIKKLNEEINKPGTQKKKNEERKKLIKEIQLKIKQVLKLM